MHDIKSWIYLSELVLMQQFIYQRILVSSNHSLTKAFGHFTATEQ